MMMYMDPKTGLPKPSYDLWEEKWGTSTYTCSSVYGALRSAMKFANILGKRESEEEYGRKAEQMRKAIIDRLYNEDDKYFYKRIKYTGGTTIYDPTIDMSAIYGIINFHILDVGDHRVKDAIGVVEDRLMVRSKTGGVPRYMGDWYYRADHNLQGNPWFITTLWLAQYYIAAAKTESDLEPAKKWLEWTVQYALPSGILSEQIHPHTGDQISSAPLTWSHSEFIMTVLKYMEKIEKLGIADMCKPLK